MALTTIAPTVTKNGASAATYDQILEWLKTKYRAIYGDDVYLEADSLDGQFLGVLALEFTNVGAACVQVYNSFNPKTALSDALTRNVKINGIQRSLATYSTVDLLIAGTPGTAIRNGVSGDVSGNKWALPALITIPSEGTITVTATAVNAGALLAQANTVTTIVTPTRGWMSVTNPNSSSMGQDLESDSKLRQRQALSTSIASMCQTDGLRGAILDLDNVTRCKTFENDENVADENGLPSHSLCVIVSGGDSQEIAQLIASKKSMGCALYGNTDVTIINSYGDAKTVSFYRPDIKQVSYHLNITSTESYSADTADSIAENLAAYTNALDIGDRIMMNKLYGPSNLFGAEQSQTYEVDSISIVVDGVPIAGDYTLPFGCVAFCDPSDIAIEVLSG